jgi:hypothetical protein
MSYELKQVTLLEIEVETQREQIKVLRAKIKEQEQTIALYVENAEKYSRMMNGLISDLTSMYNGPE